LRGKGAIQRAREKFIKGKGQFSAEGIIQAQVFEKFLRNFRRDLFPHSFSTPLRTKLLSRAKEKQPHCNETHFSVLVANNLLINFLLGKSALETFRKDLVIFAGFQQCNKFIRFPFLQ
jgi:hypothetical protein